MRYPASEKLEIIRLVEQSSLLVRHTMAKLGIPRATFYRWYDRHSRGGPEAPTDRAPRPDRVWNRIPDAVRQQIVQLVLDEPALSPREFAVRFTDTESYSIFHDFVQLKLLDPPSPLPVIADPVSKLMFLLQVVGIAEAIDPGVQLPVELG
jgi:hypothetical protein